jgi:hypothetical protein
MSGLDTVNQNILGLVALLVSLVALVTTVLQVLQQYFSSAEGYRRCTVRPLLLRLQVLFSGISVLSNVLSITFIPHESRY